MKTLSNTIKKYNKYIFYLTLVFLVISMAGCAIWKDKSDQLPKSEPTKIVPVPTNTTPGPQQTTSPQQTGPQQTSPQQTGPQQTSPQQTGPQQTGPQQPPVPILPNGNATTAPPPVSQMKTIPVTRSDETPIGSVVEGQQGTSANIVSIQSKDTIQTLPKPTKTSSITQEKASPNSDGTNSDGTNSDINILQRKPESQQDGTFPSNFGDSAKENVSSTYQNASINTPSKKSGVVSGPTGSVPPTTSEHFPASVKFPESDSPVILHPTPQQTGGEAGNSKPSSEVTIESGKISPKKEEQPLLNTSQKGNNISSETGKQDSKVNQVPVAKPITKSTIPNSKTPVNPIKIPISKKPIPLSAEAEQNRNVLRVKVE